MAEAARVAQEAARKGAATRIQAKVRSRTSRRHTDELRAQRDEAKRVADAEAAAAEKVRAERAAREAAIIASRPARPHPLQIGKVHKKVWEEQAERGKVRAPGHAWVTIAVDGVLLVERAVGRLPAHLRQTYLKAWARCEQSERDDGRECERARLRDEQLEEAVRVARVKAKARAEMIEAMTAEAAARSAGAFYEIFGKSPPPSPTRHAAGAGANAKGSPSAGRKAAPVAAQGDGAACWR